MITMKRLFSRLFSILPWIKKPSASGSQQDVVTGDGEGSGMENKVEAYVLDQVLGADSEWLDEDKIPTASIARFYRGRYQHLVMRDRDGNITLPKIDGKLIDGETPNDLYDASYDEDSPQAFCKEENPWKGPVTKAMFGIVFAMLVFLWFVWSANMGS